MPSIRQKAERLLDILSAHQSMLIAFSGGVDSSLLVFAAHEVMPHKVIAVTAESEFQPKKEINAARSFLKKLEIRHEIIRLFPLANATIKRNPKERCYHCKKELFENLTHLARKENVFPIAHGANLDDFNDFRPGQKAAEEYQVIAPLVEARLTKKDIRALSQYFALPTWNKPAMACLATRIPYGSPITKGQLEKIAAAEAVLFDLHFEVCRVRLHEQIARIEIAPADFPQMIKTDVRLKLISELKKIGFACITLDLTGYVQGSLNDIRQDDRL